MSKIEFKSMAQRITIPIVVILIVVCAGMGIISYKISANTVTKEIEETLSNFSRQNADKILTEIKKDFHVLEITAYLDLIKSPEVKIDDKLSVLRSVIEMTSFRNMGIVDLEGTLLITNNQEMDVTDREYFQQALRGETYVGDPVISRADGTLALVSATPIYVGDSIKGVLMGERDASFLNDMTAEMGYGERGYAFITNSEGVLVAHDNIELIKNEVDYRELAKTDPGYAGAAHLIEKMVEQEHGTLRYHFAGEDRFSGYHPIGNTGWSLGMSCYESDILAGAIRIRNIIIALSLCAIILGTVFSLWLGKSSLAVLAGASQFANVMAGGDFSVELPDDALGRKDEIGDLAKSFDRMQKSLGEMFSNIKQGADRVYDSSETLASSSEEMSASLEEVSASTNEFASNAQHLSESSERMYELGNQVSERAQGGYQAVEKAVSQMETISGSVSELQENVTFLNSEAGKVGNIIDTIKGIAGQTNLLALNAAIEAARAGEQGRGFAVVAEEVRKLAEQSASSAEKITVIIESIQAGVYGVSQQMAEAVKDVESGTEAVLFSGEALRSIVDEIQGIASQIDQVAATTQEISSGSEELSAAVEEQTATMNEISNAAVDLRGLVEDLNDAVNKFIF